MKLFLCTLLLFATCFCHTDLTPYLKKDLTQKTERCPIKNIDFIYLINLDQRPEKLAKALEELKRYEIYPHRFSAVYGWSLSVEELNGIGVRYGMPMKASEEIDAICFATRTSDGRPYHYRLKRNCYSCYGKTFFVYTITPGAIGCSLSHLSVLQDAYDAGFETIWIMEDDILVKQDPYKLSSLLEKLDALVGDEGWDILYTDTAPLEPHFRFLARPDMYTPEDRSCFAERTILSEDFIKLGHRMFTHSMIIRRSGMKKILDFEKNHHIFMPYDHELAVIPGIRMFGLRYNLVSAQPATSDTVLNYFYHSSSWPACNRPGS